jgi:hypothetical protein
MFSNIVFFVSESLLLAIVLVLVIKLIAKSKVHGKMVVMRHDDGSKTFSLELEQPAETLEKLKSVTFKVVEEDPESAG